MYDKGQTLLQSILHWPMHDMVDICPEGRVFNDIICLLVHCRSPSVKHIPGCGDIACVELP